MKSRWRSICQQCIAWHLTSTCAAVHAITCVLLSAGQYNDAAYSLVQLRKILEDSCSQQGKEVLPGSELAALQTACTDCERSLEEVRTSTLAVQWMMRQCNWRSGTTGLLMENTRFRLSPQLSAFPHFLFLLNTRSPIHPVRWTSHCASQ